MTITTTHPARRLRHGERPTEQLVFEDDAANKAAEEGVLPDELVKVIAHWKCDSCGGIGHDGESHYQGHFQPPEPYPCADCQGAGLHREEFCNKTEIGAFISQFSTIAADRASRQVANKAEVEPSDSYKAGYADGMEEGAKLAFWGDKPSEKFPEGWPAEIWLNAGDDELGPFSEYDEVSWCSAPQGESDIRYIREDLLATDPATTGASTVLTDERIEELFVSSQGQWAEDSYWKIEDADLFPFARAIACEVAAQAGQVAVPEDVLRVVRRLLDGSQPQDVPGAVMVIDAALAGGAE